MRLLKSVIVMCLGLTHPIIAAEKIPTRQLKFEVINKKNLQKIDLEKVLNLKLKTISFKTTSQYDKGNNLFEGVYLEDFIKTIVPDMNFKKIKLRATDDYTQTLTKEEILNYHPLLAFKMNEHFLLPNNRGTFRIVFDYTNLPHEVKLNLDPKWIWNIKEVEVLFE